MLGELCRLLTVSTDVVSDGVGEFLNLFILFFSDFLVIKIEIATIDAWKSVFWILMDDGEH